MLISEILKVKGHTLFTTTPAGSVADAVDVMVQHDVGSLVVMDHGHIAGMLSFREVLQAMSERRGGLGELKVSDIMVREPHTASPHDTADVAQRMMFESRVRYLPIVEGTTLLGVISFRDIQKAMLDDVEFENRMLKGYINA
jgi:CBS domain-containing protein